MSNYNDFLNGLPERTLELLKYYDEEKDELKSYEVTLLISLAMPAFVITSEEIRHVAENDKIKVELDEMLVSNSFLLEGVNHIKYGKSNGKLSFNKINHSTITNSLIESERKVMSTLKIIRNALSHGSIKLVPNEAHKIDAIMFGSKNTNSKIEITGYENNNLQAKVINEINDWSLLFINVGEFKQLLENWCSYLLNKKNPMGIIRHINEYIDESRTGTYE